MQYSAPIELHAVADDELRCLTFVDNVLAPTHSILLNLPHSMSSEELYIPSALFLLNVIKCHASRTTMTMRSETPISELVFDGDGWCIPHTWRLRRMRFANDAPIVEALGWRALLHKYDIPNWSPISNKIHSMFYNPSTMTRKKRRARTLRIWSTFGQGYLLDSDTRPDEMKDDDEEKEEEEEVLPILCLHNLKPQYIPYIHALFILGYTDAFFVAVVEHQKCL